MKGFVIYFLQYISIYALYNSFNLAIASNAVLLMSLLLGDRLIQNDWETLRVGSTLR